MSDMTAAAVPQPAPPPTVEDALALGLSRGEYELVCEKLLANPLVEDYEVQLLEGGGDTAGNGRGG